MAIRAAASLPVRKKPSMICPIPVEIPIQTIHPVNIASYIAILYIGHADYMYVYLRLSGVWLKAERDSCTYTLEVMEALKHFVHSTLKFHTVNSSSWLLH